MNKISRKPAVLLSLILAFAFMVFMSLEDRISSVESGLWVETGPDKWTLQPLQKRMEHYDVPGVSIAVIDNFKIDWAKGYGVLDATRNDLVTTGSLFHAGSIAKPVSAAAALMLVEKGYLDLEEDVNRKLTSWKIPENEFTETEKVTLRRLLSHSAGLNRGGSPSFALGEEPFTIKQTLDASPSTQRDSDSAYESAEAVRVTAVPGSRFLYSNGGYGVLTLLLSDVTAKSFDRLLSEILLVPLGMSSSTFEYPLPDEFRTRVTSEHRVAGEPMEQRHSPRLAAGGLWTTPTDLGFLTIELMLAYQGRSERILSQTMVQQMFTEEKDKMGLGFVISNSFEGRGLQFSHGGATYESKCHLYAFAERGQGVIIMTNARSGGEKLVPEIFASVAKEYGWLSTKHRMIIFFSDLYHSFRRVLLD